MHTVDWTNGVPRVYIWTVYLTKFEAKAKRAVRD